MPKYTYQAGAHWPKSLLDLTDYRDADNTVGILIAQIKSYQEAGDFDAAQELIRQNYDTLKHYTFSSGSINKYIEELRNLEIYTKSKKQQIFYEPTEEVASIYAVLQDVWIGNVGDSSTIEDKGNALDSQVLEGITYINQDGTLHTGTMRDYGAVDINLASGEIYQIPNGYHNGGGVVRATGASPSGGTVTLPTITVNGWKDNIDVSGASFVQFRVDVPTIMTGSKEMSSGTISLDREIQQFVYITGNDSSNNALYSAWFKDIKGKWQKKNSSDGNGITAVSGNIITIKYTKVHTLYYYAW